MKNILSASWLSEESEKIQSVNVRIDSNEYFEWISQEISYNLKVRFPARKADLEAEAAAERQKIKAQADADAGIIKAEGDAEIAKIGADSAEYQGQKDAAIMKNLGEMLTRYPDLIDYYRITGWDGKLPETMLGDGTDILFGIGD